MELNLLEKLPKEKIRADSDFKNLYDFLKGVFEK
jgi:hypothetical protein